MTSVELFIAVLKPGIGIVIHYKHNLIPAISINENQSIDIDWFNQSIKIDTHSPNGLNCYWTNIEVGLKWKLHPENAIQWCDPKMLLEKYHAGDSDTEKFIDPSKLKLMLPRLEKLEEERLQKQKRANEQERKEAKKGAPENLSKDVLKEILIEHGITFTKSAT